MSYRQHPTVRQMHEPSTLHEDAQTHMDNPHDSGLGVMTNIKSFQGQPRYSGLYGDELENIAEIYERIVEMFDSTARDKRKELCDMLTDRAQSFFTRNGQGCSTFENVVARHLVQ